MAETTVKAAVMTRSNPKLTAYNDCVPIQVPADTEKKTDKPAVDYKSLVGDLIYLVDFKRKYLAFSWAIWAQETIRYVHGTES